ncbi:MAG: hypothetical protein DRP85_04875 [Candidatus Makaraimicrobium thalassicum]|nr:MAG: hypothetical protein DRP85_04875 [Candidatus Omnitrophota bacterium]
MIAYLLIIAGFMMRLLPHAPNVAPVAAIALFSGAYLNKRVVPWVPLVIMVISDLIIGLHDVVLYTWGAFIVIGYMGMRLRERRTPAGIFTAAVFSSLVFFVISNFGVWLAWYPHTGGGFVACYVRALPFLRSTLIGNILFVFALFGAYELARKLAVRTRFRNVLLVNSH